MRKTIPLLKAQKRESRKTTRFINTLSWSAFGLSQWAVLIAGTYLCISNQGVTPGVILMATLLMNYISLPLQTIPPVLASRKASNDLILKFSETLADNEEEEGQQTLDKVTKGIVINNLSFAYEQNKAVLKNLSIKLLPNKSYAIVGISGSGKSTLFNLLMGGNLSYQGNIFYDSLELRTIDKKSLYQNVSLVQQENFLFNASIEDNITMFENHSKDAISQACEKAGLTDFIKQNKLSYQCGEAGSNLSGGERQRICIARSLLKGSRVLFFDEADSFLGKRIQNVSNSSDQAINSLRSQMLILLENFEGVVIFATNLADNYDKAFESRILKHIHFDLPTLENREAIINITIPSKVPFSAEINKEELCKKLAEISDGFSGREIKNAVLESLTNAVQKATETLDESVFIEGFEKP